MAYRYNSMTGRVSSTNPSSAYNPSGLTQTTVAEESPIQWAQTPKKPSVKSHMGGDGIFGKLIRNRVYENQAKMIVDSTPIHLKLGARDRISFVFAMGLTVAGTLWTCYSLFELSRKKE